MHSYLQNLHETGDVQLRVQGQVVDVCNEGGDLLLEEHELVLQGIDGKRVVLVVIFHVVIRASILSDRIAALLSLGICGTVA